MEKSTSRDSEALRADAKRLEANYWTKSDAAELYIKAGTKQDLLHAADLYDVSWMFFDAAKARVKAGVPPEEAFTKGAKLCEHAGYFELAAIMLTKAGLVPDKAWELEAKLCERQGDTRPLSDSANRASRMRSPDWRADWLKKFQ